LNFNFVNVFLEEVLKTERITMKSITLWIISFIITIGSAYYQRITGPTYPVKEEKEIYGGQIKYQLERSHSTSSNYKIEIPLKDTNVTGYVEWKRYKTNDEFTRILMKNINGTLIAEIPAQPAAGKLMYQVYVGKTDNIIPLTEQPVVIRFKGDVPAVILIPHVILIFLAMLLSTRTGLEIFAIKHKYKEYTKSTLIFLILGGMIFGPVTQLYAFGELWTGIPFGWDLTDNKTLIAFIGWIITAVMIRKSTKPKVWIIFASLLTLIIFIIPHSVLGSELDYSKMGK
jgi:hypothetical protein